MKSICILCSGYPSKVFPHNQVFVQQFAWALADMGIACTVICPAAVNLHPLLLQLPDAVTETTDKGAQVKVYFPKFFSFGQQNILGFKTAQLTTFLYFRAIHSVWQRLAQKPEVVYGHFLTPGGVCAGRISKRYNVPSFAAYGESTPWSVYNFGVDDMRNEIASLKGIVAVSTANRAELEKVAVFPAHRIQVFPNGIRTSHFYPRDKKRSRIKFGIPQDLFVVAFLGEFSDRKGVLRLAEAARGLENVGVAFAGYGALQPDIPNAVFTGLVPPADVPEFLSAADVFVLPTLNEGCCNAIIEAMACGLPIISSDLPFNTDILNSKNALLIDPGSVKEIRAAITHLRDRPELCRKMGEASLEMARNLSIEARARNISSWMAERMQALAGQA